MINQHIVVLLLVTPFISRACGFSNNGLTAEIQCYSSMIIYVLKRVKVQQAYGRRQFVVYMVSDQTGPSNGWVWDDKWEKLYTGWEPTTQSIFFCNQTSYDVSKEPSPFLWRQVDLPFNAEKSKADLAQRNYSRAVRSKVYSQKLHTNIIRVPCSKV